MSLRKILAEEGLKMASDFAPEMDIVTRVLGPGHPKAERLLLESQSDSVFHPSSLADLPPAKMKVFLEAMVAHWRLNILGPDMPYERVVKRLPAIRKALGNLPILTAFERDTDALDEALNLAGLLGPRSDRLRDPADRYY